jgi:hypothetical protein
VRKLLFFLGMEHSGSTEEGEEIDEVERMLGNARLLWRVCWGLLVKVGLKVGESSGTGLAKLGMSNLLSQESSKDWNKLVVKLIVSHL